MLKMYILAVFIYYYDLNRYTETYLSSTLMKSGSPSTQNERLHSDRDENGLLAPEDIDAIYTSEKRSY